MNDKEELIKQREIGQQIIIIRIIHDENDKVSRGGFSLLDRSEIAKWAQKSEEELEFFLNDIAALDEFNICVDAALEYASGLPADAYGFFLSTFRKHGYLYIESLLRKEKSYNPYAEGIEDLACINAKKIIDKGLHVDEDIQSVARFEDSLKYYFNFYIGRIKDVVCEGYDWDVVCEMLGEDKAFTDLIKPLVDNAIIQERKVANIKKNCENCHYYELTRLAPYCTKGFRKRKLEFGTEKSCKRWRAKENNLMFR